MKQTAVEFLEDKLNQIKSSSTDMNGTIKFLETEFKELFQQAKEMEKQRMIDLVQQLKDYTRESRNVLGFDEREACEFVEIFTNQTFKSE